MCKILALTLFLIPLWSIGQLQIDPVGTINDGGQNKLTSVIVDWSLGEAFSIITIVSKTNALYTTGFLQGMVDPLVQFSSANNWENSFQLGPNPIFQNSWLRVNDANLRITKLELLNSAGQIIQVMTGPFSGIHFSKQIPMGTANTGNYFLLIYYVVGELYLKMKIIPITKI